MRFRSYCRHLQRLCRLVMLAMLVPVLSLSAQQAPADLSLGQVRSPVLIIDIERIFSESLFGQRISTELQRQTEELAAENRQIEAALTEEERSLTLRRPDMDVAAFRAAAEEFDTRVQEIRRAQDGKERALQLVVTQGRDAFLAAATPVLAQLMAESGAAVILDRRSVFLGVDLVDVTNIAIAAIDAQIGDGAIAPAVPEPDPAPAEEPDPEPVTPDPADQ